MLTEQIRQEIINKTRVGSVLIVVGETGSGKSTGVPGVLLKERKEEIIVTEPRRVAAISLAEYVKKRVSPEHSEEVGYKVRFKDGTTKKTRLKYLTDGMLLKALEENTKISTVILDEIHERSIRTDILLGLLKGKLKKIRLVLMSATADVKILQKYFSKDGISVEYCEIPSKKHEVQIKYLSRRSSDYIQLAYDTIKKIMKETKKLREPEKTDETANSISKKSTDFDELDCIFNRKKVRDKISSNCTFDSGSILVFLSGLEDIEDLYRMLEIHSGIELLKLHSSLSDSEQRLVFSKRVKPLRIILSTNIAETSLTIEDVKWVIDSGVQKINVRRESVDTLGIIKISKSAAKQRAGRAGRVGPGVCYRLYTEAAYLSMQENNTPEILRTDISSVSLSLLSMKIDPMNFDFLESPGRDSIAGALSELFVLGLIGEDRKITELGKKVSKLPLSPVLGKFLIIGKTFGVGCASAAVCSLLSSEKISLFPKDTDTTNIESVHQSQSKSSDLTLYASLFFTYMSHSPRLRADFCKSLGISQQELKNSENIYGQLIELLKVKNEIGLETEEQTKLGYIPLKQSTADRLHAAATAGFLTRVAKTQSGGAYSHLYSGRTVYIHPSSTMFRRKEETVAFILTSETTKPYILHVFPYTADGILNA